ncbi:hypothetical protein ACVGWB_00335, partial [Enterobacter mori]
ESGRVGLVWQRARSKTSKQKRGVKPFTPLRVRFGGGGAVKNLGTGETVSYKKITLATKNFWCIIRWWPDH